MMCALDTRLLHDYIDNLLSPAEKIILEEHLRICSDCRQELNRLKVLDWDLNRFYGAEVAIPDELASLRQKVLEECIGKEVQNGRDEGSFELRDVLSLQVSTFNNSLKFVSLIPGLRGREKTEVPGSGEAGKNKSLLRKIIGL